MLFKLTQFSADINFTLEGLRVAITKHLRISLDQLEYFEIIRKSIDARGKRGKVCFTLSLILELEKSAQDKVAKHIDKIFGLELYQPSEDGIYPDDFAVDADQMKTRPVVVGAGPAGLLAAWQLAVAGANPILIERGKPVDQRAKSVKDFWDEGKFMPEDNVLFGEGGAGLFSDGKLTTRSKLRDHLQTVLELFVHAGADESILIDAEPHIGSDKLLKIVPAIRQEIINLGGEVRFDSKLESIEISQGELTSITVNGEKIETENCIIATGHSARDIYKMLHEKQVAVAPKSFAVGVRIEFPQKQIDLSQYRSCAGHPRLGAANFRLTRKADDNARACYSFCMCPGGLVISCASSEGMLTTNGMSFSQRDKSLGNAAFLVPVEPADFDPQNNNPLAGIDWQAKIETLAFESAGSDYSLPANRLKDFLAGKVCKTLPENRSSKRAVPADLSKILPGFVVDTLRFTIPKMMQKLSKVKLDDAIIYAAETRSSSPVRVLRDADFQSPTASGIFPAGEGAGYAGGIVTSAIDGLRAAQALVEKLNHSN